MINKKEQQKQLFCEGMKLIGAVDPSEYKSIVEDFKRYCCFSQSESERAAKNVLLNEHLS